MNDKPLDPPSCNPRIAAFTDDLSHAQLQSLLTYLYSWHPIMGSIKGWRKKNDLPVDRAD